MHVRYVHVHVHVHATYPMVLHMVYNIVLDHVYVLHNIIFQDVIGMNTSGYLVLVMYPGMCHIRLHGDGDGDGMNVEIMQYSNR